MVICAGCSSRLRTPSKLKPERKHRLPWQRIVQPRLSHQYHSRVLKAFTDIFLDFMIRVHIGELTGANASASPVLGSLNALSFWWPALIQA